MALEVKIIADSISNANKRITTLQLKYQRFIHAEFLTHRDFSRNASSSRAIPVAKMIEQVRNDPAMPIHWGQNQPGMQASGEVQHTLAAQELWAVSARIAAEIAREMSVLGLHKQVANRILEPFQWIHVVVTSTEWDNFFELRAHPDAQPEIQALARMMRYEMEKSNPRLLSPGEWHLPYVKDEELEVLLRNSKTVEEGWDIARKISAARCCRVSYLKHDGTQASIAEDLALCERLAGAVPIHASPFEHQASPDENGDYPEYHGNFKGWIQFRKMIEARGTV
jgi:hypothetical protein